MRTFAILAIVALLGSTAYLWWYADKNAVLIVQRLPADVEVYPVGQSLPIGFNVDRDAVHLGRLPPGSGCSRRDVTITNSLGEPARVFLSVEGDMGAWTASRPSLLRLPAGASGNTTVEACPPAGTSLGNYTGTFVATFRKA